MNILILGNATDAHAAHIYNALTEAGATVNYLDTSLFPKQLRISWQPEQQLGYLTLPTGEELNIQDIHSVYWRNFSGVYIPEFKDSYQKKLAYNDSMSTLRTFMQACPAKWVNSWEAFQFHKEKPLQLSTAKQIGATIPATLITNNPNQVIEFCQTYKKAIFKPVYGGAHTQFITEAHLEPQRLNLTLSLSPVTIQEYIPGTNIRTYAIADSVYSAEIRSSSVDFREDLDAELIPIELPESIQKQSLAIAKAFMLEWTAIDWRVKPTGEYVFLEANPSPMFVHFERQTGFPITEKLVNLLMN
ncbi:MAG: MvdC/MvdD family ATP grasp protein [Cyanobacteria bacterium P01_C01_bin.38]